MKQSIPNPLGPRFLLPEDEPIRYAQPAERFRRTEGYDRETQASVVRDGKSRGYFLLTDKRIIFVQTRYIPAFHNGDFVDCGFDIPLERLTGVVPVKKSSRRWVWSKKVTRQGLRFYEGKTQHTLYFGIWNVVGNRLSQESSDAQVKEKFEILMTVLIAAILKLRTNRTEERARAIN